MHDENIEKSAAELALEALEQAYAYYQPETVPENPEFVEYYEYAAAA